VCTPLMFEERHPCHWQCYSEQCWIQVPQGRGEIDEEVVEEAVSMGLMPQSMASGENGFPYVSLRLWKPCRGHRDVCDNNCHISIGYMAVMPHMQIQWIFWIP